MEISGIVVCVQYSDLLAVTLPRNAHNFDRLTIVTSPADTATQLIVAGIPNASCYVTDEFYDHGAIFNKGRALESGFDHLFEYQRRPDQGWILVWDADTLFPASLPAYLDQLNPKPGNLYTPRRRILADIQRWPEFLTEESWQQLPLHKEGEFPGYFQLFHASDPVLKDEPWYPVDWTHAGGCDSFFQMKWNDRRGSKRKIRPPFEVLHIGPAGKNWAGRVSELMDGTKPEGGEEKARQLRDLLAARKAGAGKFDHEKVKVK